LKPKTESVPAGVSTSCDLVRLGVGVTWKVPCLLTVPPKVAEKLVTKASN
jgi:hypothetical protein